MLLPHCRPASSSSGCGTGTANAEEADISSLLDMLGTVPDPGDPRGRQYAPAFVLAVCAVATLAGAKNYAEIARRARDIPQPLLKRPGAKWNWFMLRYQWPGMAAIRNVLTRIGGNTLDAITGRRLFRQARKNRNGEWEFALDGKVMRGAWTGENGKVTPFSAMTRREAITVAQVSVPGGTNEMTRAAALPASDGSPARKPGAGHRRCRSRAA